MGIRGELYSTKVSLDNRTYFFNVKENRLGDLYLNIVESKNKDAGGFDRQSVVLFADDLQEFLKGFDDSLRVMEKAVKEKKKTRADGHARPDRESGDRPEKDWTEKGKTDREDRGDGDTGKAFSRDDGGFKPRGEKSFGHEDRPRRPHGDRPFTRDDGGFKPRGDKPFNRDEGNTKPREERPFHRNDSAFKPRGDRPFNRDGGGFKPHGDKPFNRDGGGFKPHGDKPFNRDEGGFKPRGDRPFNKDSGGFKPRGDRPFNREGASSSGSFVRKKFVKAGKPSAGAHGIKSPMHKTRIVRAIHRKDVPED